MTGLRLTDKDDASSLIGLARETGCVCKEIQKENRSVKRKEENMIKILTFLFSACVVY